MTWRAHDCPCVHTRAAYEHVGANGLWFESFKYQLVLSNFLLCIVVAYNSGKLFNVFDSV